MTIFDPQAYGPAFAPLLSVDRRHPLDAGQPDSAQAAALKKLSSDSAFAHTRVVDADMADCCISAVWLLHDRLDESHTISQGIETPSGSFLHAIMHRREGDFWNSKYWFRRVGDHPAFEAIALRANDIAQTNAQASSARKLLPGGGWDPLAFVDLCEASLSSTSSTHELCLDLQQAEWESLFDYCYHAAIGE